MTASATAPFVSYAGAGLAGPFAIPFKFLANSDIVAVKIDAAGAETTLAGNTITGAGVDAGGTLYTAAAVATGETLQIYRATVRTQTAQYVANGPFPAATHERALDKAMLIDQEQDEGLGRTLRVPRGEAGLVLPAVASRASTFLAFDSNGTPTPAVSVPAAPVSAFMRAVLVAPSAGAVRDDIDVYSRSEVDARTHWIELSIIYKSLTGNDLSYVSPATSSYAARAAAPDVSAALDAAMVAASTLQNAGVRRVGVQCPPGMLNLTKNHRTSNGVYIRGCGEYVSANATWFRRVGDYGNTFDIGTPGPDVAVLDSGISDCLIFQDHGSSILGFINPPAASFLNKATTGVHVNLTSPTNCTVERVKTYGLAYGLVVRGGIGCKFSRIDTNGIWDSASAARQEGVAGVVVTANANTGPVYNVPTWHTFEDIRTGGEVTYPTTVSYPGGNSQSNAAMNIGPRDGFVIECCEEIYLRGCNISASQRSGLVFRALSGRILQGVHSTGCTFSPCGTDVADAYVKFENQDAGGQVANVTFAGCIWLGQGNGYRALSDYGSTATYGSVVGLAITASVISTFIGGTIRLENARDVTIDAAIRDWNRLNWYAGDDACGVYLGASCIGYSISGVLGGNTQGAATGHYCIDGVRAVDAFGSRVAVNVANGGLLGAVFRHNGSAVLIPRPLTEGSGNYPSAATTFTYGASPTTAYFTAPFASPVTITLATTDNYGAVIPDGAEFTVCRPASATGASALSVGGLVSLAVGQWGTVRMLGGTWTAGPRGVM